MMLGNGLRPSFGILKNTKHVVLEPGIALVLERGVEDTQLGPLTALLKGPNWVGVSHLFIWGQKHVKSF
jgi:hypothetical protein